jgi:hypothetical protein
MLIARKIIEMLMFAQWTSSRVDSVELDSDEIERWKSAGTETEIQAFRVLTRMRWCVEGSRSNGMKQGVARGNEKHWVDGNRHMEKSRNDTHNTVEVKFAEDNRESMGVEGGENVCTLGSQHETQEGE